MVMIDGFPVGCGSEAVGEMLQQDDLNAKNRLAFEGEADNAVVPQAVLYAAKDGIVTLTLPKQSILGLRLPLHTLEENDH